jgi:hypothetical protein
MRVEGSMPAVINDNTHRFQSGTQVVSFRRTDRFPHTLPVKFRILELRSNTFP